MNIEHEGSYEIFLFDLDGTLTDPGIGITNSVMYALEKFGITVPERSALYPFIGPPLWDSFQKFYGFSEAQAQDAVRYYREYFSDKGIFENRVYDGIEEVLKYLKSCKKTLVLATSKPEPFVVRILEHFHLDGYFDLVAGATMDGSRSKKADVIRYALECLGITDRSKVLMVGDRDQDVLGAAANKIACAGVLYGYGDHEELKNAGARFILEKPEDISLLV